MLPDQPPAYSHCLKYQTTSNELYIFSPFHHLTMAPPHTPSIDSVAQHQLVLYMASGPKMSFDTPVLSEANICSVASLAWVTQAPQS